VQGETDVMLHSSAGRREEFRVRYFVESAVPLQQAAEVIAGEQSSGTFLSLPGETQELKERFRARVTRVDTQPPSMLPSLHSAWAARHRSDGLFHRCEIEIAFPIVNVGPNLTSLMATLAGNLFELGEVTALRVLDIDLPDSYASQFPGPKFGVAGTREKAGVHGRPIIGTIIKPSIGLSPQQTAELVDSLCAADIDFIKDDELMADPPYAPFDRRLAAVMPVLHKHADRTGRMPMYAINISGTIDEMRRRHDAVVAQGGTCVMVSVNWIGLSGLQDLRERTEVPIHTHRNGWGAMTRHPALGYEFRVYQKILRLAGSDQLHVNGVQGKFWEPDDSVIASAASCLAPFSKVLPIMPVFSSGQWAGLAPVIHAGLKSDDLMHLAGGGIIGHPGGIAAGVASMREGWEAARQGQSLEQYAQERPALKAALAKFGAAA
jgi:ribulose-bisphosphate carboxylase large chain